MPRRVKGPDGIIHVFPDDATDAEISDALGGTPKGDTYKGPDTFADGFWQSISETAKNVGGGFVERAKNLPANLVGTAKTITGLAFNAAGLPTPPGVPSAEETLAPVAEAIKHPVQAARAAAMAASDPRKGGAMLFDLSTALAAGRAPQIVQGAKNIAQSARGPAAAGLRTGGAILESPVAGIVEPRLTHAGKMMTRAADVVQPKPTVPVEPPPPVASATYAPPAEAPTAPQGTMAPAPGYTQVSDPAAGGGYVAPEASAAPSAVEQAVEGRGIAPKPVTVDPLEQIYQNARNSQATRMTSASPGEFLRSVRKVAMDAGVGLTPDEQAAVLKWGNTVTPTEAVERVVAARKLNATGSFANLPTNAEVEALKSFPKGMRGKAK